MEDDDLTDTTDSSTPPDFQDFAKMKFLWRSNFDFRTVYSALVTLEEDFPQLAVATKITPGSSFVLTLLTETSARFLYHTQTLRYNKIVALEQLASEEATRKLALVGFPYTFPTDALHDLPNVTSAKRHISHHQN